MPADHEENNIDLYIKIYKNIVLDICITHPMYA